MATTSLIQRSVFSDSARHLSSGKNPRLQCISEANLSRSYRATSRLQYRYSRRPNHSSEQRTFKSRKGSQAGINDTHREIFNLVQSMHENHHLIVKVATKLQGMVHAIEQTNEELQVSDKISFAAGFGCGLLVCLAIWIAPFGGGKDKDDDAEK